MPLQRRPQIPLKRALIIALDTQTKRIHDTDQLFSLGVPRPGVNLEQRSGLGIVSRLHKIARGLHIRLRGRGQKEHGRTNICAGFERCLYTMHMGVLGIVLGANVATAQGITADDYIPTDADQARIGQLLFFDKVLSGNRNISCATCHSPDFAGADGLSLGIGEGGVGIGPQRTAGIGPDAIRKRIPRNAPSLWNLGHKSINLLFLDGRLSRSDIYGNGYDSPAEEWLPEGLDNLVAAQALFPMVAQFEMAGNPRENEIAGATHDRINMAWPIIAKRVRTIPAYAEMFVQAFDHIEDPTEVTIVEIGNALSAFIISEWQSYDSPYDKWLTGTPLPTDAERGRKLFAERGCATCHSGPLFTDQDFYALGLPAFGPGRTRAWDQISRDVGRMAETNLAEDAYKFRTPSLRNVALTAPYGHNGAYPTLAGMIRQHADPFGARAAWTPEQANLPDVPWLAVSDFAIQQDTREMARQTAAIDMPPMTLSDRDISDLVAFLNALTGETALTRPLGRPESVPSGLSVD